MSENPFRLPRNVIPAHYDLLLEPDLGTFTFDGQVSIRIDITETLDQIVLNAAEIDIETMTLSGEDGETAVTGVTYDDEYARATLTLEHPVAPGTYTLDITYTGIINDQLRGLYRSIYRDEDGTEHVIATSQCQATDARRVLPCWDEPDLKATFKTAMVVAEGLEAYANGAEVSRTTLDDGRVRFEFTETMKMSTYLLAFIVGPFEATEPVSSRGTRDTDHRSQGKPPSHRPRSGERCLLLRVPLRLLRDSLSGAEAGSHRDPRFRSRRHGERRVDHLSRRLHRPR